MRRTFDTRDGSLETRLDQFCEEVQVTRNFSKDLAPLSQFSSEVTYERDVIPNIIKFFCIRDRISKSSVKLSEYLIEIAPQHSEPNFALIQNAISSTNPVPDGLMNKDEKMFKDCKGLLQRLCNYNKDFIAKSELEKKIIQYLPFLDITHEFEVFVNEFCSMVPGDKTANKFMLEYLSFFGITNQEPWIQAFKEYHGYIPTPEKKLYETLGEAIQKARELIQEIHELEPVVIDIKSERSEILQWASVEYHLPQLRDFIDQIDLSIQIIRSFQPGILRNIERQLLSLRLIGNRLAHLNDAINFEKYNTYTRHCDTKVVLQEIFGFTFNRTPTDQACLLETLNFFVSDIEDLLNNPRDILLHDPASSCTYNASERWIVKQETAPPLKFREKIIPKDGDCGFQALKEGFTRKEAVQLLLKNINNTAIRSAVAEDIRISFLAGQFVESNELREIRSEFYKQQTQVDHLRRQLVALDLPANSTPADLDKLMHLARQEIINNQGERAKLLIYLRKSLRSLNEINAKIDAFTHDKETYKNFIIREFSKGNGWLSYVRNGKGTLYALARIIGLDVRIWEPDPQHSGELRRIPLADGLVGQEINLLHTDRLTHFNVLEPFN